jgi:DNA polymerase-1
MSIKEPPLQQYPASVRRMMKFDTDAVSLDWSSIEPALFANLAGEMSLIEAYEGGGDLYLPIAQHAGVPRKVAKVILLAQFYGQSRRRLAWSLGLSEDEGSALIDKVMGPLKHITAASTAIKNVASKYGKAQTVSGRICPIAPDYEKGNRAFRGYLAVNYVVQGGAYDLLAEALYAMHLAGLDDAMYVAVHDELVVAAEAAGDVERIMRTPPAALIEQAGRTPVLRVGRSELGRYWLPKED